MALVFGLSSVAFSHSGGTDKNGCHAGSKPYHCHGGGAKKPSSSGTKKSSSSSTSAANRAKAAEQARAQAAAQAKRTEINKARTDVAAAESEHEASKERARELNDTLATAEESLQETSGVLQGLRAEAAGHRERADDYRDTWIDDREAAADRVALLRSTNRENRDEYENDLVLTALLAAVIGGLVLMPLVATLSLLVPGRLFRFSILGLGFVGFASLFGLSFSGGPLAARIIGMVVAGLLLSTIFMLIRFWWMAVKMPAKLGISLVTTAAIIAVIALIAVATTPPVTEEPAASDATLVEELEDDPLAEDLPEALEADAEAEELRDDIDTLYSELGDAEATVEELREEAEVVAAEVDEDAAMVEEAKEKLDALS